MSPATQAVTNVGNERRYGFFFLFLIFGAAIISVVLFESNVAVGIASETTLAGIFLVSAILMKKRSRRFEKYWQVFFAFFVSATVVVLRTVGMAAITLYSGGSASGIAAQSLIAITVFLATILPIIVLTKASGMKLSCIFLKRGDLRTGLAVGLASLVLLFFGILLGFQIVYGNSHGISFYRVLSVSPLVLIAAALNAPNEELWFRGLFLRKYEPLLGRRLSNLLQAPVFVLAHVEVQYSQFGGLFFVSFLALVFFAGLGFGYLMQRTDSLIGPSLAHMGADIGIYLPLLLALV